MAEHLVERPGVCGNDLVGIRWSANVGPFVQADRHRLGFETGNALEVFLVVLVFYADLRGRGALPFDQRLILYLDLLAFSEIESLIAGGIEMLTKEVNVVEAVREQVTAPISGRKIVGNDLAIDALA